MSPSSGVELEATSSPAVAALCGLTVDDWLRAFVDLLPTGPVWPRDLETTLVQFFGAPAEEMVRVLGRDCDLLDEAYPCGGDSELLPEWERLLGLPDECTQDIADEWPIAMRQAVVCAKLAAQGGQTIAYYIELAAIYGFTITITEHTAWIMGCTSFCDARVGTSPHWWTVSCAGLPVSHQTVGCWRLGEPMCVVQGSDVLECIIRRAAPAHTFVSFNYTLHRAHWNSGRWNFDGWTEGGVVT
jgi:uncharacterized protein YmfQ (DUF2313 family)